MENDDNIKKTAVGSSPAVQWLRLCASTARGTGLIPGQGKKSHMLHGMDKKKGG